MKNRNKKNIPNIGSLHRSWRPREHGREPTAMDLPANPLRDLPPNETIRKHPDEVYGDTDISHRRAR